MMSLTTKESIILFDMEFYSQIDGVAMGSHGVAITANIGQCIFMPSQKEVVK